MGKRTYRGLRVDLGFTQKEMAEELGVPIATYQRYERYESKMPVDVAIRFADLFGIVDLRTIKN